MGRLEGGNGKGEMMELQIKLKMKPCLQAIKCFLL